MPQIWEPGVELPSGKHTLPLAECVQLLTIQAAAARGDAEGHAARGDNDAALVMYALAETKATLAAALALVEDENPMKGSGQLLANRLARFGEYLSADRTGDDAAAAPCAASRALDRYFEPVLEPEAPVTFDQQVHETGAAE